ncbi:MAG: DUF3253 domain-containing protein [Pseudomonadota bacterium]
MILDGEIEAAIRVRAAARPTSFCPSEIARALAEDWRPLMPEIRRVAARMQADGNLTATQRGTPVIADEARGPIRLQRPPPPPA